MAKNHSTCTGGHTYEETHFCEPLLLGLAAFSMLDLWAWLPGLGWGLAGWAWLAGWLGLVSWACLALPCWLGLASWAWLAGPGWLGLGCSLQCAWGHAPCAIRW